VAPGRNDKRDTRIAQLQRALAEALEQQAATSAILRVLAASRTDVQPILDTIVANAGRVCDAEDATLFLADGAEVILSAYHGAHGLGTFPIGARLPLSRDFINGRTILDAIPIHVHDVQTTDEYPAFIRDIAVQFGYRSALAVPLVRDGVGFGVILIRRTEVRPFSDDHIELLRTFADQAVIAIENARLLTELQARTQELTRSVEQLTALGEVGRAVSSTLDLETVLTTIVSRAVQLSGLDGGVIFEYDAATAEFVQRTAIEQTALRLRGPARVRKGEGVVGRTAITLEPVEVPDIAAPSAYDSRLRESLLASGVRALLAVPMVREGMLIGSLVVNRNQPGEFPPATIELLRTFATQSALAIQNARLFHEIEEKSRQLEVANTHKDEFLANMSHELRTPLNGIIGFSEVMLERMFGDLSDKQEEYLKDILESGRHLLSLINDILDLSKIEAGKMELEVTEFHAPTAIDNALTLMRERAARRGQVLERLIEPRVDTIRGDERKVKQVLLNLLSNAVKFTPEGGRITVGARLDGGHVLMSITDTGIGIAPEHHEVVFEEFRQVGHADKKAEGTGLGLALCRKFVELHGGRIWLTSEVGKGSTFTFNIPLGPPA